MLMKKELRKDLIVVALSFLINLSKQSILVISGMNCENQLSQESQILGMWQHTGFF